MKVNCPVFSFLVEVPVAFSTRLTDDTSINESPVIFDVVDLNIGDGYDEFTGNLIFYRRITRNYRKYIYCARQSRFFPFFRLLLIVKLVKC